MKILIIGLGSIAKKHIATLEKLNIAAEIFALRSSKDAQPYAGVTDVYDLSDVPEDIDFVMICNPTNLHFQTIQQVQSLGKPLFIEKPVVRHLEEIDALSAITVPTYIACHLRHHPCVQFAKDSIGDRKIKAVHIKCGSYMPDWIPSIDWKQGFRADKKASGGVHLELIHELDYATWIFGKPSGIQSDLKNSGELGIDIVDDASYTLTYPKFEAEINVNYIYREASRYMDIEFEDSVWHVDILNFRIEEDGEEIFSSDMDISDVYASQMQYFLNCLHEGIQPMNSVQEAAEVLKLALD